MKVPLRFQVTEFDCGTIALLNAFSYLFDREDIPAELVRVIHEYTLDCYDENGNLGQGGTSKEAINMLTKWMENFAKKNTFNIKCERFVGDDVTIDLIKKQMTKNTAILVRSWLTGIEHYVIITNIDDNYVYIFDSYFLDETYYDKDKEVEIIFDEPFKFNRRIKISRLNSETKKDFSLGLLANREILVINKTK